DLYPSTQDLASALGSEHMIPRVLAAQIVAVHAIAQPNRVAGLVDELFDAGTSRGRTWLLLAFSLLMRNTPTSWIDILETLTNRVVSEEPSAYETYCNGELADFDVLHLSLALAYAKAGSSMPLHHDLVKAGSLTRRRALNAVGVCGVFYPEQALTFLASELADDSTASASDYAGPLGVMYGLYPDAVDEVIGNLGDERLLLDIRDEHYGSRAAQFTEVLGLYNNGVHQALNYPRMRAGLLQSFYGAFLVGATPKDALRRYTQACIGMLLNARFDPARWFEPKPWDRSR
ncbi:MAG: hypothetical protein ACREX3_17095, partial [Gammaproteobacteria bacterium]